MWLFPAGDGPMPLAATCREPAVFDDWSSGEPAARVASVRSNTDTDGTAACWSASTAPASGAAGACSPTTAVASVASYTNATIVEINTANGALSTRPAIHPATAPPPEFPAAARPCRDPVPTTWGTEAKGSSSGRTTVTATHPINRFIVNRHQKDRLFRAEVINRPMLGQRRGGVVFRDAQTARSASRLRVPADHIA